MEKLKIGMIIILLSIAISCMLTAYAETPWFEEKGETTTLHFYVQHVETGPGATACTVTAANITATSPTSFGQVHILDDKLTVAPELDSDEVGRLQAAAASTDMRARTNSASMNYCFTSGKYNGSTVTIVGRNPIGEERRELPVVGGTGAFRLARGYAVTSTYHNEDAANRKVLEYAIHVITSSASIAGSN